MTHIRSFVCLLLSLLFSCVLFVFVAVSQGTIGSNVDAAASQGASSPPATATGKHYQWQLLFGQEWRNILNDHVIETHYCQPGAEGMTINAPTLGQIYINFDSLDNSTYRVQRLTFLPVGQTEDVGWYFRDTRLWCEYGSKGTGRSTSSVKSSDVEQEYNQDPRGVFSFTVGSTTYTLDFSEMSQTNSSTGVARDVRRRPKFNSTVPSTQRSTLPLTLPRSPLALLLPSTGYIWEFMGDEGQWTEYDALLCKFDSDAIERHYQQRPQGTLKMKVRKFTYTLDFAGMVQVNDQIGTQRALRRTPVNGTEQRNRGPQWQFQDEDGTWKTYTKAVRNCSVGSQEIEAQYQQNPAGVMKFNAGRFSYDLDFSDMTQRNLSTNKTRRVQRLT